MVCKLRPIVWVFMGLTASVVWGAGEQASVRPGDNGAELANPGMGWVFHYDDNEPRNYGSKLAPSDTLDDWPGLTVIYLRVPWSYIEPEEGRFNWSVLDTPAQRWIAKGKQIAFRITSSESWMRWATPRWVADAGARGYNFRPGKGVEANGPFWEPDFDDPVFLAKLDRFLAAMAARHDGNPEVAFVDVGSLGVWGEGHTWASTQRPILPATVTRHVELHKKHFRKTLLVANDDLGGPDASGPNKVMKYAVAQGLTLRDDSILVQAGARAYFHAAWAGAFWPKVPVILESEPLRRLEGPRLLAGRQPVSEGRRRIPRQLRLDPLVAPRIPRREPLAGPADQSPDGLPAATDGGPLAERGSPRRPAERA